MAMRPRELLANWLLCVVLCETTGHDWTLSDDPTGGDGIILNRSSSTCFLTEHVFVPPPHATTQKPVAEQIEDAIRIKSSKGDHYAKDRTLIVFCEAHGNWFPNKVGKSVDGTHGFEAIWVAGLEGVQDGKYVYWMTRIESATASPAWKIHISTDFTNWIIEPIQ